MIDSQRVNVIEAVDYPLPIRYRRVDYRNSEITLRVIGAVVERLIEMIVVRPSERIAIGPRDDREHAAIFERFDRQPSRIQLVGLPGRRNHIATYEPTERGVCHRRVPISVAFNA